MTQTLPGFPRLTVESDKLGGRPCIRGYWFGVEQLWEVLSEGMDFEEIHADFPFIERDDVHDALRYAAAIARREFHLSAPA